jgi:hypothetical protein
MVSDLAKANDELKHMKDESQKLSSEAQNAK